MLLPSLQNCYYFLETKVEVVVKVTKLKTLNVNCMLIVI